MKIIDNFMGVFLFYHEIIPSTTNLGTNEIS